MFRRAFTLLELLVVISIIAVLVGILMPVLASTREAGRSIQCLSNMRQMGIAASVYNNDYAGYFPPAYSGPPMLNWDINIVDGQAMPGLLWQGQGSAVIQICPSYNHTSNDQYVGYNYNSSFIGRVGWDVTNNPDSAAQITPARIHQIKNPSTCIVFGDGEYGNGAPNKFMRAPHVDDQCGDPMINSSTRAAGTQGLRHQGATNALAADGHGTSFDQLYDAGNTSVAEGTGFFSNDNSRYHLQ